MARRPIRDGEPYTLALESTSRAPMIQLMPIAGEHVACIEATAAGWVVKLDDAEDSRGFATHFVPLADFDLDPPLTKAQAESLVAIIKRRSEW